MIQFRRESASNCKTQNGDSVAPVREADKQNAYDAAYVHQHPVLDESLTCFETLMMAVRGTAYSACHHSAPKNRARPLSLHGQCLSKVLACSL